MDDATARELAIRNLVARYADAVAVRDAAAWAATWAPDGEWHILGKVARGRGEVVALWKSLMSGLPFVVQLPSSGMVSAASDRPTGRWYVTEYGKSNGGDAFFSLGVYDDEYCRVDGRWLFASRRFRPLYTGPPDLGAPALGEPPRREDLS